MKHLKSYELYEKATGDCYQAAGRLATSFIGDDKALLVHGMVEGQGKLKGLKFGHAWVEYGNKAMDHSNGNKFEVDKRAFYAIGNIDEKECFYYKPGKAAGWMLKTEHCGPWEMSGDPIKLNEDIPDEQDEIGKKKIKIKNKDMKNIAKYEDFDVNEGKPSIVTRNAWKRMSDDQKIDVLLTAVKDSDEAMKYYEFDFEDLPPEITSNMYKESVNEVKNMPKATKVWDELVKTFSDNKNDSIEYLNKDKSYRGFAIQAIFRAMNF